MMFRRIYLAVGICVVGLGSGARGEMLLFEDFEDSAVGYTTSVPELSASSGTDYFGRVAPDGISVANDVTFTNTLGDGYFGAQDIDGNQGSTNNISSLQSLTWSSIDISGFENLSFSGFFAEDDDGGSQDWDASDSVSVSVQIDGGGFFDIFNIESEVSSGSNGEPRVDTNFDGVGNGVAITDTFTQFSSLISGTGSLLDLRIEVDLNAGDEDIAFDNIAISGTAVAVPEMSTLTLVGLAGVGGMFRRRRRRFIER